MKTDKNYANNYGRDSRWYDPDVKQECDNTAHVRTCKDMYGNIQNTVNNNESNCDNAQTRTTCCCKKSMAEALSILCDSELADYIDFEKFAFISNSFIVGAKLVLLKIGTDEKDNLSDLSGTFRRFAPCDCDLIQIDGTAYYNFPQLVSLTDLAEQLFRFINNIVDAIGTQSGILGTIAAVLKEIQKWFDPEDLNDAILQAIADFLFNYFTTLPAVSTASLCNIESIAFETKYVKPMTSTDTTRDEVTEENYKRSKEIIQRKLDRNCKCGIAGCNSGNCCNKYQNADNCCCADSILDELANSNLSHKATITAGNLTLREATVLGSVGDVLVIANDKKRRFYFVCANAVQFLE